MKAMRWMQAAAAVMLALWMTGCMSVKNNYLTHLIAKR